jgi:hypothetical protein
MLPHHWECWGDQTVRRSAGTPEIEEGLWKHLLFDDLPQNNVRFLSILLKHGDMFFERPYLTKVSCIHFRFVLYYFHTHTRTM